MLESHVALTDSPVALRLLARRTSLPFVRVQPIHFQGTLQDAWKAVPGAVLEPIPVEAGNYSAAFRERRSALCLSPAGTPLFPYTNSVILLRVSES